MTPIEFEGVTIHFRKPVGWDAETRGECVTLPVQHDQHGLHSVWRPSDEERMAIAAGGAICLTVVSIQHPPVALRVIPTDEPRLAENIDPILDYAAEAMWEVFRKSPVAAPVYADMTWPDLLAMAHVHASNPKAVVHEMVRTGRAEMRAVIERLRTVIGFLDRHATDRPGTHLSMGAVVNTQKEQAA